MKVTVARSLPGGGELVELDLPAGARLQEALDASGWAVAEDTPCGIWGKVCPRTQALRELDRVEIYRPLVADPKTARRRRVTG